MTGSGDILTTIIAWAPAVIFSITLHEWAHGYMAFRFGDPTPAMTGRLTLNPIPHIDPIWTIAMPTVIFFFSMATMGQPFVFGGAKPVMINSRNFRGHMRTAMFWVAAAGPLMNLILGLACAMLLKAALLLPDFFSVPLGHMLIAGIQMNVLLAVFNLFPILPLDGGRIVAALLPHPMDQHFARLERLGFPILLLLVFTGALSQLILPPMIALIEFFLHVAGVPV
ncbi:MAG: site-2 protease family protein [Magnetococcales bacterium]|nr:site-2 protease family protein [Magnetococcales bacterium]